MIVFVAAILFLVYSKIWEPIIFLSYSDLAGILTTLMFVYLTYETLRQTRQNEVLPYINAKFILASIIGEEFLKKYPGLVINEQVKRLIDDFKKEDHQKRDMLFILIENIGGVTAIDVQADVNYTKRMFGKDTNQTMSIPFGILKSEEVRLELMDHMESPGNEDYFEIKKIETQFNTVSRKYFSDGPTKNDSTKSFTHINEDRSVTVILKK